MVDVTKTSNCDVCAQWQPFLVSCYTTRSKHQLVAMSEWVNNLRQPLSKENGSSSLPRTRLATVVLVLLQATTTEQTCHKSACFYLGQFMEETG